MNSPKEEVRVRKIEIVVVGVRARNFVLVSETQGSKVNKESQSGQDWHIGDAVTTVIASINLIGLRPSAGC